MEGLASDRRSGEHHHGSKSRHEGEGGQSGSFIESMGGSAFSERRGWRRHLASEEREQDWKGSLPEEREPR